MADRRAQRKEHATRRPSRGAAEEVVVEVTARNDRESARSRRRGGAATTTTTAMPTSRCQETTTTTFVEHFHHINAGSDQRTEGSLARRTSSGGKKPTAKQIVASRVYNLSLDVAALRQQLQELTLHKSLLQTRALYTQHDADGSAFKKTVEYWHVFRRGFRVMDENQPAFIMSAMADNMQIGLTRHGRVELLQQWQLYTDYFAIRQYERRSTRVIATDSVSGGCITRSEGVFRGSFTRRGLEMVFPSVLHDLELAQQLLRTKLVTPVAIVLHFDARGVVVRQDGEADFMHALHNALGSIIRAAGILKHARLLNESMVERHDDVYYTREQLHQ